MRSPLSVFCNLLDLSWPERPSLEVKFFSELPLLFYDFLSRKEKPLEDYCLRCVSACAYIRVRVSPALRERWRSFGWHWEIKDFFIFSSRRAARPRHWKTTGSPELGNVEAVTYLVNLDNFPISQRAHCRVPSFVFSCRVSTAVCTRFCRNSLSLSFLFLTSFFFLLLDITIVFTRLAFVISLLHTSTLFGCCFIHNPAHFQRRSIKRLAFSALCVPTTIYLTYSSVQI